MFRAGMTLLVWLLVPTPTYAQTTTQVWANVSLEWARSHGLTYLVDVEPKVLISAPPDEPGWNTLDLTPSIEFAFHNLFDLIGEGMVGRTNQTDNLDSNEATARAGLRIHLLSRHDRTLFNEHLPKRRLVVRDLFRAELRHLSYSNGQPSKTTGRLRNRVEVLFPINRSNLSDDGAWYLTTDWETFVPTAADAEERFANRQRIRAGIGIRESRSWRYSLLYVWTRSRNTIDEPFTTTEHAVEVQIKRVW